jgi:hypothetical protein
MTFFSVWQVSYQDGYSKIPSLLNFLSAISQRSQLCLYPLSR